MNKTKIEWCDSTWNPVTGCYHGCDYCYARGIAKRFGKEIPDTSDYHKENDCIHRLDEKITYNPYPYLFEPTFIPFRLKEPAQKSKPQTIFVCSMADLFGWWVPDEWIEAVFEACEAAPWHRYLFLTKNVSRYAHYSVPASDNMWYGISITQNSQLSDFNYLPAYCHTFISFEPLLENLDVYKHNIMFRQVHWFIIGAETGKKAGNKRIIPQKEWIDSIVELANKYHKPVFMKDSLIPIIGEKNMRREFPWER